MAKWHLLRESNGSLTLSYLRPRARGVFKAGSLHRWTDLREVIAWIVGQEVTAPGDVLEMPDGEILCVQGQPEGWS